MRNSFLALALVECSPSHCSMYFFFNVVDVLTTANAKQSNRRSKRGHLSSILLNHVNNVIIYM